MWAKARGQGGGDTVGTISAREAIGLVDDPDTVFVDVRERDELPATGIIRGAAVAPLSRLAAAADLGSAEHVPALSSGKRLVLYCATGRRSATAAHALAARGVGNAVNLAGGPIEPAEA